LALNVAAKVESISGVVCGVGMYHACFFAGKIKVPERSCSAGLSVNRSFTLLESAAINPGWLVYKLRATRIRMEPGWSEDDIFVGAGSQEQYVPMGPGQWNNSLK
jgi:hypothetical protein